MNKKLLGWKIFLLILLALSSSLASPNLPTFDGPDNQINYQHQFMALLEKLWDPLDLEQDEFSCQNDRTGRQTSLNLTHIQRHLPMELPTLNEIGQLCPKNGPMSLLFQSCREALEGLGQILMDARDRDEFLAISALTRNKKEVNPHLWLTAFIMASASRDDMTGFRMPSLVEVEPELFIHSEILQEARQSGACKPIRKLNIKPMLDLPYNETGTDSNPEHRLAYFREDVSVNNHHTFWHSLWPPMVPSWAFGPFALDNGRRERAGELFYHMHHEVLARYDVERMSNGLERTEPLDISLSGDMVENGYFPKLNVPSSMGVFGGRPFGGRQDNTTLQNLDLEIYGLYPLKITFDELMTSISRINEAIDDGYVVNALGERIELTEKDGTDLIGNVIESGGTASPNYEFYGNLHNDMHGVIAYSHDPTNRHNEMPGVMIMPATSMRDPVFYKWHKYIDNIYVRHKFTLPLYSSEELNWSEIHVNGITVQTFNESAQVNRLETLWATTDVDLSIGLATKNQIEDRGPLLVTLTHLDHRPFFYEIEIENSGPKSVTGMVRIFMAPKFHQQLEHEERLKFLEQRDLFFTLDIFNTTLLPGVNKIVRNSTQSSVTIPPIMSFREMLTKKFDPMSTDRMKAEGRFGCGWPQNMLLPRGSLEGLDFDLFVMVTDSGVDEMNDLSENMDFGQTTKTFFEADGEPWAYCGILNATYPDTKPMGFPFDRNWDSGPDAPAFEYLEEAVASYSNMFSTQIQIVHVQDDDDE